MFKGHELMQPLHIVVPPTVRDKILRQAIARGVSAAEVARELLVKGLGEVMEDQ
jgi:hypothetical protein